MVCFTGDGGFWYHIGELETAARYGINAVVVVNDNHSLNQDRRGTERAYSGYEGNSDEIWQFQDIDFSRLAEATGCFGIRVDLQANHAHLGHTAQDDVVGERELALLRRAGRRGDP